MTAAPTTARVVIFRPGAAPEVATIDTSLEAMQALLDGYLEEVRLGGPLVLYVDEEGRLKDKPTVVDKLAGAVVGVCVATAVDDAGDLRSLDDDEIETVKRLVTPVSSVASRPIEA